MQAQMRKRWLVLVLGALVIGALIFGVLVGPALAQGPQDNDDWSCPMSGPMGGMMGRGGMMGPGMGPGMMGRPTPAPANQPYDLRFLNEMIAHHQMGVVMTQHMVENSARPEMRDLAQRIITAQQREIEQMRQWRVDWYGVTTAPNIGPMGMMGMGGMGGMMGRMDRAQMREAMRGGMDRDRMFLVMMIPHHEDAIDMANAALQQAQHTEIKALAQDIITTQTAEIAEMRAYLQQWYGQRIN